MSKLTDRASGLATADSQPRQSNNLTDELKVQFYRLAAGGLVPPQWFEKRLPAVSDRAAASGRLTIEIVSHCWQYAHLMQYQLSSLVLYPPRDCDVIMTVCYSPQDNDTASLLEFFASQQLDSVSWNPLPMDPNSLFRRAIGRNQAALRSRADWVWFTDCDLLFHKGCLDSLNQALQGRQDALVYPRHEGTTALLASDDPLLRGKSGQWSVIDIDTTHFELHERSRATGSLQITHGDVARACGYCDATGIFQQPASSWRKAREDRVFRWLLQTQGTPIEVPGVFRIRHIEKGRYQSDGAATQMRKKIRKVQSNLRGEEVRR